MADLISLFRYQPASQDDFLPYLLIQSHQPELLQSLSPDIMQISDDVYAVDLHIVESYWRKLAAHKKQNLNGLLENMIQKNLKDHPLALFCQHPYQGLVFFNHLRISESQGVFRSDSLFSQKIYKNMGWFPWFLSARQINDCLQKGHCLNKERQNFSSQLAKFSRFVERMDLQEFSNLQEAHFFEIARRFKGFIGLLWKWTFQQKSIERDKSTPLFSTFRHYEDLQGFPWIPYFMEDPPQVDNLLEFPVSDWEALQEALLYDLEKLSRHEKLRPPYKVMEMRWTLTLFDMSQVQQTLRFKHPLCLETDKEKDFSILHKQFQFAFDQFKESLHDKDEEWQWVNAALIVGWSVQVSKGLILTGKSDWLDLEEQMQKIHDEELLSLTNKIKTGLKSFKVFPTFIPGFDFSEKDLLEKVTSTDEDDELLQMPRPFYILPQEEELSPEQIKQQQFLDRTSSDWWNRQDSLDSYRDCFLCELTNQEFVFAYRNYQGRWFRYGF